MKALVHHGAKVECRIRSGPQALHLAAEAGHSETVAALLEVHIKISNARTTKARAREHARTSDAGTNAEAETGVGPSSLSSCAKSLPTMSVLLVLLLLYKA